MTTAAQDREARRALEGAAVFQHPLRLRIVELVLEHGRCSPSDIAEKLDEPVSRVSYHVVQLRRLGLLRPAGTEQARGAIEHFYRADRRLAQSLDHLQARVDALRGRLDRDGHES